MFKSFKARNILIAIGKESLARKDIEGAWRCKMALEEAFSKRGLASEVFSLEKKDFEYQDIIKTNILEHNPLCVFNLFEGFNDDSQKEAEFVSILEDIDIPYTGNSSYTLSVCLDKAKTKDILRENDILTPRGIFIKKLEEVKADILLDLPLFIKPCFEDASLGIDNDSLVTERQGLYTVLEKKLKEFPRGVIVEEFIPCREYNVGFLGDFPYELLGISVLDYSKYKNLSPFLTYHSKWEEDSYEFRTLLPSLSEDINGRLKEVIINVSKKAGKALGCRSYFRVDVRERDGDIFVLDINPNPDINRDSGFMRQAYYKGYLYEDIVVEKILLGAIEYHSKKEYVTMQVRDI